MTNQEKQHIQELDAAKPVLEILNISENSIIQTDKPDIIIPNFDGKKIGIEIMECRPTSIDSNNKNGKAYISDWITNACKECAAKFKSKYENGIIFLALTSQARQIDKKINKSVYSKRIISECERHINNDPIQNNPKSVSLNEYIAMRNNGAFKYAYAEHFTYHYYHTPLEVNPIYAYWTNCIKHEHILKCVHAKEEKLPEYKAINSNRDIDEYWLLLNLPVDEEYDFSRYDRSTPIESSFKRIYLTQSNEIIQLK